MILLDTNVVSEPLRPAPSACVVAWIDAQPIETLYLSAMTVAELRAGVALMPAGRRRDRLHDYINRDLLPAFLGRVIPFDLACTAAYAEVLAETLGVFQQANPPDHFHQLPRANHARWAAAPSATRPTKWPQSTARK